MLRIYISKRDASQGLCKNLDVISDSFLSFPTSSHLRNPVVFIFKIHQKLTIFITSTITTVGHNYLW